MQIETNKPILLLKFVHGDAVVRVTLVVLHVWPSGVGVVDRDDVLPIIPSPFPHGRVHQNAPAERVLTAVILPLTPPVFDHSRRAENGDHLASLADVNALLRRLVRTNDVRHARRVQEVLNRLVAVADRARPARALAEARVVQPLLLLVLRGVRPQQVVRQLLDLLGARVRRRHAHRRRAGDHVDAVQRRFRGRQRPRDSAVHAEDDVVDGGGEGQVVEDGVGEAPDGHAHVGAVLLLQLTEEAAVAVVGLPAVR